MLNAIFQHQARANGRAANPASLALMRWTAADYDEQQRHYLELRRWYSGDHKVPLTDRQKEYLARSASFPWSLNYLRLPVELCIERLTVTGFDGPAGIGGDDGVLDEWWTANRMDATQSQLHRAAAVDGDTYLLIEWDEENGRPRFSHEPAYDGAEGMKVHYLSNLRREMTMASKVWTESRFDDRGQVQVVRRLNLYTTEAIERYEESGRGWQPYNPDGGAWPIANPIGRIPVVHFRWHDDGQNWGESEIEHQVPLQQALNKAALDEITASDKTGTQILTLSGALWPEDPPGIEAGGVYSTDKADARWGVVPPADLSQLRDGVSAWIIRMAQRAHIPLQYFQVTGAIASAATQAADDGQLVAKVKSLSVSIGNAWEDAMYIALKLREAFQAGRDLARGENIETRWADFERVDPLANEERRANIAVQLVNAGFGLPGIVALPALGFSEEEQAALLRTDTAGEEGLTQ